MRLASISAKDVDPVKMFSVDGLSDIVVLAGPNGVGKTRLIHALLAHLQNPSASQQVQIVIEATSIEERNTWGKTTLNTAVQEDCNALKSLLHVNRRRRKWRSNVVFFEDDRSIQNLKAFQFTWDIQDPDDEDIGWNTTFAGLKNRWQDTLHAIFRKVEARRKKIADKAERLMQAGESSMALDFSDPIEPFRNSFGQLLAPKRLTQVSVKDQQLYYELDGRQFPISALSSGEKEVVNTVFDFLMRDPRDCITIFDEPELHLHPELSYKLIQTLRSVGERNQFVFCTHSPEVITASLENSVVFISPPKENESNQAIVVREDDETHHALQLLGQSIGIISLGRKIVLIEGDKGSLDKQTYGSIVKSRYPNLVLVPSEGKYLISAFAPIHKHILEKTIWGVEFFMLCDRDAVPLSETTSELQEASKGRLRTLNRYHLENYFLDEKVLASVFSSMEAENSWLTSPQQIRSKLVQLSKELIPYGTALLISSEIREQVANFDIMPKGCHGKSVDDLVHLVRDRLTLELDRLHGATNDDKVEELVREIYAELECSLESGDDWKTLVPGRPVLHMFANRAKIPVGRLKLLYIKEAERYSPGPFKEIIDIFDHFDKYDAMQSSIK